jgi:WD40 repeat protein
LEPRRSAEVSLTQGKENDFVFACPDFIVADQQAQICQLDATIFEEYEDDKKKGRGLVRGHISAIQTIAVHPVDTVLAIGGKEGFIEIWDYSTKKILINIYYYVGVEKSDPQTPPTITAMEFTPDGNRLLAGFSNGIVRILDPQSGEEDQKVLNF